MGRGTGVEPPGGNDALCAEVDDALLGIGLSRELVGATRPLAESGLDSRSVPIPAEITQAANIVHHVGELASCATRARAAPSTDLLTCRHGPASQFRHDTLVLFSRGTGVPATTVPKPTKLP